MADQQQIIDELIDYIDKAVLKHSVSNRHVAEVLSWLNEELKKINTEALKKMFLSKNQRDEAKETITFLKDYSLVIIWHLSMNKVMQRYKILLLI